MSVFKIKLGDISINVVEIGENHLITIYLWNSDWNLRTKISEFTDSNPTCSLITKHDENADKSIYHAEDELYTQSQIRTIHTHLKYHDEITPQKFSEFLAFVVENGRLSLTQKRTEPTSEDLRKITEWKEESLKKFIAWHEKNSEKVIIHHASLQTGAEINYTSNGLSFGFR